MTRVLLTGFAPFEGESLNPSWQAVRAAAAEPPAGIEASAIELPCVYGASGSGGRAPPPRARPPPHWWGAAPRPAAPP
ncbi:pyroglutamyl-peptidase I family protein, partial [Streptomyces platensis]